MKAKYILSIAIAALALVSCGEKKAEGKDAAAAGAAKPVVKIAKATSDDIPQDETYTATVESDIKNNIAPNMARRIEKILVEVGDQVTKGQILVKLNESNLRQLQLQMENQKVEYGRMEQLYNVGGASKAEYDNAKTQYEVLKSQYQLMHENTQLVAPFNGVVTARNYDNGDMYSGAQPVLVVETINPVKLMVNISENFYKLVKKGMPVDITLDAYDGEKFDGKISIVYPTIDVTTHTFPVEILINNSAQKVRPGMFARATINFGDKNHTIIPDEALVKQIGAGDRYVYVYKNGKVSYNLVQVGKHIGKTYEIISGVEPGDDVVVAGQSRLANGIEVEVQK